MTQTSHTKLLLLLGTGAALGLNFPLGKMALSLGVHPAIWAALISFGAGLALLLITTISEQQNAAPAPRAKFAVVSGLLSYVMPNFLTFAVIPHIGSGLASIMFALSPVVTATLSIILKVRPPNLIGIAGIGVGLVGALMIILGRGSDPTLQGGYWIYIALLIPIFLGLGNVYRTMAWPVGASPRSLAAFTNLSAVPFLCAIAFAQTGAVPIQSLFAIPGLVVGQIIVSTIMFLMFFRLQQIGGPTYLSQIGYVAAAVGLFIGVSFLGETYSFGVWAGAGVIALGIAFSTLGQPKTN
jgi:drug/metabolite transporter (DMT)-like permease